MVRSENIDHPVEVARLPGVVGKVARAVDRRAVAPPEDVLLLETLLREVDPEDLVFVGLRQAPDPLDDPVHIAYPDEIALPDEPVVAGVQGGEGRFDAFRAEGDGRPELPDGLCIAALHLLHEAVDLLRDLRVLPDRPVRRDVDPGDVMVRLLTPPAGKAEVVESPGDDGDLAAHIV
ncbi:hypothetical protein DSECCO2_649630 [anaerobic digester metagenome]